MRSYIIFVAALLLFPSLHAQIPNGIESTVHPRSPASISVGLAGYNLRIGYNFDYLVVRKPGFNISARVGLPLINSENERPIYEIGAFSISTGLNLLIGKKKKHFDVGLNVSLSQDQYENSSNPRFTFGYAKVYSAFLGYRFQKPSGGFYLRTGLLPQLYTDFSSAPRPIARISPVLDLGYTIPSKYYNQKRKTNKQHNLNSAARVRFKPTFNAGVFLGYQPTFLWYRKSEYYGGQGGGTSFGQKAKNPTASFSIGLQFDAWVSRKFGLELDLEWVREKLDFEWATRSWSLLSNQIYTTEGNLEMSLSSFRVPLFAKVRFGNDNQFSLLAGPYMNFLIVTNATGTSNGNPIDEDDLLSIPNVNQGLSPSKTQVGLALGFEMKRPINENSFAILKIRTGRDFNKRFQYPSSGVSWAAMQIGYGIHL